MKKFYEKYLQTPLLAILVFTMVVFYSMMALGIIPQGDSQMDKKTERKTEHMQQQRAESIKELMKQDEQKK